MMLDAQTNHGVSFMTAKTLQDNPIALLNASRTN